jgi:hypothetical protein
MTLSQAATFRAFSPCSIPMSRGKAFGEQGLVTTPPMRPRLPNFVERAQVPDDLARLLRGKQD